MKSFTPIPLAAVSLLLWQPALRTALAQTPAPAPATATATATATEASQPGAPVPAAGANPLPAKGVLPTPFPAERYAALFEKSPFAIASAAPEPVVPTENFATNWVLAGISKQKGKDGSDSYTVFVRSRDLSKRLVISSDHPDDGVSLVSVDENPVPAKSTAILRKDAETGRVEFDQAAVAAAAPPPVPTGQPPKPGVPTVKNTAKSVPIPRPGMQGAVPRPGASQIPPPSGVPAPGAPAQQEPRRRVRPIQEPP